MQSPLGGRRGGLAGVDTRSANVCMFGRHFHDLVDAQKVVAAGTQAIANRIYANRMGNGDEASGDGWRYRGQGPIQITGHDNHQACGAALGLDLLAHPEQLQQPGPGSRSAGWYWLTHGCNELADKGNFVGVCGAINTGNPSAPLGGDGYALLMGYVQRMSQLSSNLVARKQGQPIPYPNALTDPLPAPATP